MKRRVNNCMHCDECINCGAREFHTEYYCDKCHEWLSDDVYRIDSHEFCRTCTIKYLMLRMGYDENEAEDKVEEYADSELID